MEFKVCKEWGLALHFKGMIFLARLKVKRKVAREEEQHVFRKVKPGLKHDALKSCLEERVHTGECWTVERIRFPAWVPLCFYYGKM